MQESWELTSDLLVAKSFPAGIRRVREHRALGHRTLLITGALDFVIEPFRPLFDDVICAHMTPKGAVDDGRVGPPPWASAGLEPVGRAEAVVPCPGSWTKPPRRARPGRLIMAEYAKAHGLDLAECVAYADSTSDLPMLEAAGYPGRRQPRDQAGGHRPQAGLARRALAPVRRLTSAPLLPFGPMVSQNEARGRSKGDMKALQVERSLARFAMARVASEWRAGPGGRFGPLRLVDVAPPELPGPGWQRLLPRLAGICGSDLATVDGRSSRWFEPIVSFPFVPGHEVVADTEDGQRVVIEPVLGCEARGIQPLCPACADGRRRHCVNLTGGHISPGLQTGYCKETGGGWSLAFVAHESQLHPVPEGLADEAAVLVEPAACAVHAALSHGAPAGLAHGPGADGRRDRGRHSGAVRHRRPFALSGRRHPGHRRRQAPPPARPRHPSRGDFSRRAR